ncbi:MAG: lytic transglycosylase domain-containing protein, partial [Pseudomonadota bacterium]
MLAAALLGAAPLAHADAQADPELRDIVAAAIAAAECFPDKYQSAVWYQLMEPKLRQTVKDRDERVLILKTVFCEANRPREQRLAPGLVLAVIEIESRFDRWAVSSAGAVGLMQVMPFWPAKLGM